MEQVKTVADLDNLPAGSVVLDLGPNFREANAPVVACKAAAGDWQVLGGDPGRRWRSEEVIRDSVEAGSVLAVAYNSFDGVRAALRRQ